MDPTFMTNVTASSSSMLAGYLNGMFQIILAIGPYVIGLILLGIFVRFVIWVLHRPRKIGGSGK